jgi:Putative metal-binding motif
MRIRHLALAVVLVPVLWAKAAPAQAHSVSVSITGQGSVTAIAPAGGACSDASPQPCAIDTDGTETDHVCSGPIHDKTCQWKYVAQFRATPAPGWAVNSLSGGQACTPAGSMCVSVVLSTCVDGECTDAPSPSIAVAFADVTPPVITALDGPHDVVRDKYGVAQFTFAADGPGTFGCALDGGAEVECASPLTLDAQSAVTGRHPLTDGAHSLRVVAIDTLGRRSDPAVWQWSEETLETGIDAGPAEGATVGTARTQFRLSADHLAPAFECAIDGGAYQSCDRDYSTPPLADGAHTLQARAVVVGDGYIDRDSTPAVRRWIVDTRAPVVRITGGPDGLTNSRTAVFSFAADEAASFACSLDGSAFSPCSSPVTLGGLSLSEHTFRVRAADSVGNTGAPEAHTWRITADLDGDGSLVGADCNDTNPAIHPGAVDIPRNHVDEDCDGRDADYPRIGAAFSYAFGYQGPRTRLTALRVTHVPAGSTIRLSCRRGCPLRTTRIDVRRARRAVDLEPTVRGRIFGPGMRLELRVSKPGTIGTVMRIRFAASHAPARTDLCLDPQRGVGPCR